MKDSNLILFCFVTILLSLFQNEINSQELLLRRDISLRSFQSEKRETLPIVDTCNNQIALFIFDRIEIRGVLLSTEFERISEYNTSRPKSKYVNLLGYSIDSGYYHLFYGTKRNKKFITQSISITDKSSFTTIHDLRLNDEEFIETFSLGRKFYILTIRKNTSVLVLYEFDGYKSPNIRQIDFSNYQFSRNSSSLYDVLCNKANDFMVFKGFQKVDILSPGSLNLASKLFKIYQKQSKVILTLDNNPDITTMIKIDLNNFDQIVKSYSHSDLECMSDFHIRSNSYYYLNNLYQIIRCKDLYYFKVTNTKNDSIISDVCIINNSQEVIKNTPFIQDGGLTIFTSESFKEIRNINQFIRKLSPSKIGISAYNMDNRVILTIGGSIERTSLTGNGGWHTTPGQTFSTDYGSVVIPGTSHYNPLMYGYSAYTLSRIVYFKSSFSINSMNSIDGVIPDNAFEKIREFEFSNGCDMDAQTIFWFDDYFILAYYNEWEKLFYLRKFTD